MCNLCTMGERASTRVGCYAFCYTFSGDATVSRASGVLYIVTVLRHSKACNELYTRSTCTAFDGVGGSMCPSRL